MTAVIDEAVVGRPSGAAGAVVASYHGYRQRGVAPGRHLGLPSPYLTLIFTLDEPLRIVEHVDGRQPSRTYDALAGVVCRPPASAS